MGNPNPLSYTLRRLRADSGLSGMEAARLAGLSQSKVSRAETGSFLPTELDVVALCEVYQAPAETRRELVEMTRELRESSTAARTVLQRGGWWMQQRIGKLEAAASRIRNFSAGIVIGLVQTERYIDALLGESLAGEDRTRMVESRLERQRILDSDRDFHLIMAEGALRWNMGGSDVMATQLDRVLEESRRPNVRLGIVEWTTPTTVPAGHGFTIYDSRAVLLGTATATAVVTDRHEVDDYEAHWNELVAVASFGDTARVAIQRIAEDYRALGRRAWRGDPEVQDVEAPAHWSADHST